MHISSFFSSRWMFSRVLLGVVIITALLLVILRAGITHAAGGQAHFEIDPSFFPSVNNSMPRPNFIYNSHAGALIQDSLHVRNNGTARGTVIIYTEDAITSQSSGEAFPGHNDPRHDVGAWITPHSQQVTLNPGQGQDIPFILSIPAHVRPGQHAGGFVAEEPDRQASSSLGSFQTVVRIHTREVTGVLINLPGTTIEKLKATTVTYGLVGGKQAILVGLANTGTQFLHPSGRLKVMNAAGQQLQKVPMQLHAILPQTSIDYPVYIHHQALAPGTYTVTVNLGYEGKHKLNYTGSVVVPRPQLQNNSSIPRVISDLVTPNTDFFSALTPWHYVVGISFLFFILSALFFWCQKIYQWKRYSRPIERNQKTSSADLLEIGSKRSRKRSRTPKD